MHCFMIRHRVILGFSHSWDSRGAFLQVHAMVLGTTAWWVLRGACLQVHASRWKCSKAFKQLLTKAGDEGDKLVV